MSYPSRNRKITVIGVQNMRRLLPNGKEEKVQVPVIFYGKIPNTFLKCKEDGCKENRLSGTARCQKHVIQYH